MKTYEPDSSASDTHLLASTEGKGMIGRFWLLVVIDTYSRAIVSCRIGPRPICASSMPEPPSRLTSEAVISDPAVPE